MTYSISYKSLSDRRKNLSQSPFIYKLLAQGNAQK